MRSCERPEIYPLLKEVSRSFYLTLRVLPRRVRFQIGLAYLLARATDTIADTEIVPVEQRLRALAIIRDRVAGKGSEPLPLGSFGDANASPAERSLLLRIEDVLAWVDQLSPADQESVRAVLATIISGQELDLQRFSRANSSLLIALPDEQALDDYIYRVAGCVGEFWSRICRAHLFPTHSLDEQDFIQKGIRFGKGLQLVNVLRDLPADLRQGRCYLPANRMAALGLTPADLLEPANYQRLESFYNELIALAEAHLKAGWDYTNMLPRRCIRLRLACAWPILIGLATLAKLRRANVLDQRERIKVSRAEVRRLMMASLAGQVVPGMWGRLPARAQMV